MWRCGDRTARRSATEPPGRGRGRTGLDRRAGHRAARNERVDEWVCASWWEAAGAERDAHTVAEQGNVPAMPKHADLDELGQVVAALLAAATECHAYDRALRTRAGDVARRRHSARALQWAVDSSLQHAPSRAGTSAARTGSSQTGTMRPRVLSHLAARQSAARQPRDHHTCIFNRAVSRDFRTHTPTRGARRGCGEARPTPAELAQCGWQRQRWDRRHTAAAHAPPAEDGACAACRASDDG